MIVDVSHPEISTGVECKAAWATSSRSAHRVLSGPGSDSGEVGNSQYEGGRHEVGEVVGSRRGAAIGDGVAIAADDERREKLALFQKIEKVNMLGATPAQTLRQRDSHRQIRTGTKVRLQQPTDARR